MINDIKAHIQERIAKMRPQLQTAREMYQNTKDEGWGARMVELKGRLSEIELILHKIERYER